MSPAERLESEASDAGRFRPLTIPLDCFSSSFCGSGVAPRCSACFSVFFWSLALLQVFTGAAVLPEDFILACLGIEEDVDADVRFEIDLEVARRRS